MEPYVYLIIFVTLLSIIQVAPNLTSQFSTRGPTRGAGPLPDGRNQIVPKQSRIFEKLIVFLLISFAGFRYYVGTDFLLYQLIFLQIDPKNWGETLTDSPQEVGFTVLSLIVRTFTENSAWLFFVSSALTVLAAYFAMRLISTNVVVSLAIYVLFAQYLFSFNAVRQGIAISLVYLAIALWVRRRRAMSVATALIALSFHTSSIIAIFIILGVWIFRRFPLSTPKYLLMFLPVSIAVKFALSLPILNDIAQEVNPRYSEYLSQGTSSGIGTYLVALVLISLGLILVKFIDFGESQRWMVGVFVMSIPFSILATSTVEIARLGNYFSFSLIFLVPLLMHSKSNNGKLFGVAIVLIGYIYFFFYLLNYDGLLPYQDVFNILRRGEMNIHIPG